MTRTSYKRTCISTAMWGMCAVAAAAAKRVRWTTECCTATQPRCSLQTFGRLKTYPAEGCWDDTAAAVLSGRLERCRCLKPAVPQALHAAAAVLGPAVPVFRPPWRQVLPCAQEVGPLLCVNGMAVGALRSAQHRPARVRVCGCIGGVQHSCNSISRTSASSS